MSAELVDPTKLDRVKMQGKTYVHAKTFKENTSNLAPVKVDTTKYEFTPEEMLNVNTMLRLEV